MLKLDQSSGRLLPVPRLRLRSQDPGREYDLARIISGSPAEFFSEIDETVFLIGVHIGPKAGLPPAGGAASRVDLLALDLNGRPVAVIVHESKTSSCFARSLLCSEWLAAWRPEDFLRDLSPDALERLRQFLRADLHAINREQRVVLVGEQHNHEVLWAARSLRTKCGVDITLIRAAVAVDPGSGVEYLSLRREFPAVGAAWETLVEQKDGAVEVDSESVFSETADSVAVEPEATTPTPAAPAASADLAQKHQILSATAATPPDKNEALRTLAAGFAEFLSDTEAAIAGSADLAVREAPRDFAARQRLEAISRIAERISRMSEQLRVYAGRGTRTVAGFDVARLLEHSIESAGCLLLPNVELRTELTDDLGELEGDSTQIAQVISHLLNNAVEALPERGGTITLRSGRVTAAPELPSAYHGQNLREGEYFYVDVSDTGYGMDDELKARIFDPFFSTKASGRGLGLMAVLGIVQNHEGSVEVESTPGKGSTFRVLLPVPRKSSPDLENAAPQRSGIGSGRTVLVIGDQESLRSVARQTLEAEGFRVLATSDGWEALEVFARSAEQIDLVVLDWMLSKMDADEAFRAIRRIRNDTRVILCGGFSEEEASRRFSGKKFAGYLRKPFQPETLLERVAQLLEEQPAPSRAKAS